MEVTTRNDRIVDSRRTALELLLSNHYADCVSPCMEGCPAHVDAQGYIALSAMGLYRQAVDLIRETNPLPAICGRVCVRKCEVVCRRADVDTAVGINAIKRFVTDQPGVYDGAPACEPPTGKNDRDRRRGTGGPHRGLVPRTHAGTSRSCTRRCPARAACSATASPSTACPTT